MEPLGEPVEHEEEENKGAKIKSSAHSRGNGLNYEEIATKLLNENFLLTALELHTELVERGRGIKTLKEFFSNPGNFERQASIPDYSPTIPRSSSQATLDSLDLTRYSEDGERGVDERVAVLEFELRKAKETINALRANLTVATESENLTPESGSTSALHKEPIKPHEKRALNFLVNEYLMRQGYKLTSITFSDENEDQDFEDWDDVGLNIPKPPELLFLYRESSRQWSSDMKSDIGCQTMESCHEESQSDAERMGQLHDLIMEADLMREQITVLQQEKQDLQALIDANGQKEGVDVSGGEADMEDVSAPSSVGGGASPECFEMVGRDGEDEEEEEGVEGGRHGDGEEGRGGGKGGGDEAARGSGGGGAGGSSSLSSGAASETGGWTRVDGPLKPHPSTPTLNSMASTSSTHLPSEMTTQNAAAEDVEWLPSGSSIGRKLPSAFRHQVLSRCFVNTSRREGSLVEDILAPEDATGGGACHDLGADARILRVAHLLARSLPRIVPNVVLTQREELIPLMICTVWLHPDPSERNRLLSLLFNLKKRPTPEERQTILAGIVAIAKCSGLSLVEGEILPQCWEQIGHRHMERRLLVAESCSALAPYVSATVRNSLMLSMLQQMLLEESEEEVRAAVVTSIALVVAFVDDKDKYFQCEELTVTALGDTSELVRACAMDVLLPVLAQWALMLDRLHSHLFHRFLHKLKSITTSCIGKTPPGSPLGMAAAAATSSPLSSGSLGLSADWRAALTVRVLKSLLPHLLTWVVDAQPVWRKGSFVEDKFAKWGKGFTCLCHGLFDPAIFHDAKTGDMKDVRVLAGIFQDLMEQECPETWPQLEWLVDEMLPGLMSILRSLDMAMECAVAEITSLFYSLCCGFGRAFTIQKINPLFVEVLQGLEGGSMGWWSHPSLVPVYLIGVLAGAGQEESDISQVGRILSGVLRSLPPEDTGPDRSLSGGNGALMALEASVVGLCQHSAFHETVLTTLWEGVVHPRAGVRGATASLLGTIVGRISEPLVVSRVAPALITLASDPDVSVKAATIPAFGTIITHSSLKSCPQVQDKAHMQIQSFLVEATAHEFGHGRAYSNLLLTLVTTLRSILPFSSNAFRDEVVLPQLSLMASHVSSVWKGSVAVRRNVAWADGVAVALVETFATALDCASSRQNVASILLPGLRCLEAGGKEFLPAHHDTVLAMIREAEIHNDLQANRGMERTSSGMSLALATANMGQGVEDMRNRMTKIFQVKPSVSRPSNLPNIPGIFRKK